MNRQATYGGGGPTYSLLSNQTISTALSLPHHTIFIGDCGPDGLDDETNSSSDGHINSNSYYCCSKPMVALDLIWNLSFVVVSVVVLVSASRERPSTPLRIWVSGYALQCLLYVGFVYYQYHIRRIDREHYHGDDRVNIEGQSSSLSHSSIMKSVESINTMISSIWWVIGFYWIVVGGQTLLQDSPCLYWSTVVLLAFDMFFIIFCIGMACIIFLALFCCIPILAIAYAVAARKRASEDDIRSLSKYRYCEDNRLRVSDIDNKQELLEARLRSSNINSANEVSLLPEDSECCICLSRYANGMELYKLPCKHHFHCGCISKWLRIKATCPLCKINIRKCDTLV